MHKGSRGLSKRASGLGLLSWVRQSQLMMEVYVISDSQGLGKDGALTSSGSILPSPRAVGGAGTRAQFLHLAPGD